MEITPKAEYYYFKLMAHLYKTHSLKSAGKKSSEVFELAKSLNENPNRGRIEENLAYLNKEHQFLVYAITNRKTVKIIYFVNEELKKVYVTDFFPTEMDSSKIKKRK